MENAQAPWVEPLPHTLSRVCSLHMPLQVAWACVPHNRLQQLGCLRVGLRCSLQPLQQLLLPRRQPASHLQLLLQRGVHCRLHGQLLPLLLLLQLVHAPKAIPSSKTLPKTCTPHPTPQGAACRLVDRGWHALHALLLGQQAGQPLLRLLRRHQRHLRLLLHGIGAPATLLGHVGQQLGLQAGSCLRRTWQAKECSNKQVL